MSTTSQVTDFQDIYTDILNRVRAQTGVTATTNQAKRYANIALMDMHVGFGEKFAWAERSAQLITQPEYKTGTVVATQGSATIVGTSTAWDTANAFGVNNVRAGGKIVIAGSKEVYEISQVTSGTGVQFTSRFVGADVSAATYSYFEDEYALSADFLRPVDFQSFDINNEIELIGRNEFRRRYPRNKVPGKPRVATLIDLDFGGVNPLPIRKVRFAKPPDIVYLISYAFITNKLAVTTLGSKLTQLVSDTDEPIVPLYARHAIVFHALKHWYRDKKDDSRANAAGSEYSDIMLRLTGDREIGASRPRLSPVIGPYASRAHRPYRGRAGRYVTGNAFDELRE